MSEDLQPFATSGSGKSEAEVAFELVSKLKGQGVWGERNMADILDMFAECLDAAKGLRKYEGQNRYDAPVTAPFAEPRLTVAQAKLSDEARLAQIQLEKRQQQEQAAQMQQQQHAQMQQQQQPVRVQQQAVQQAFKG